MVKYGTDVFYFDRACLKVQGAYFDFAGQWTRTHTLKGSSEVVTDGVLRDFQNFVNRRQEEVRW